MRKIDYETKYAKLSEKYSISARKYFKILQLAIYHLDDEYLESSYEVVQHKTSQSVWQLACEILETLYADHNEDNRICPLCGRPGNLVHNGAPLVENAQVCEDCNYNKVIPARLEKMKKSLFML